MEFANDRGSDDNLLNFNKQDSSIDFAELNISLETLQGTLKNRRYQANHLQNELTILETLEEETQRVLTKQNQQQKVAIFAADPFRNKEDRMGFHAEFLNFQNEINDLQNSIIHLAGKDSFLKMTIYQNANLFDPSVMHLV